ncbi:MAG: AMP-binding protein [Pseudomonadota bacterium]
MTVDKNLDGASRPNAPRAETTVIGAAGPELRESLFDLGRPAPPPQPFNLSAYCLSAATHAPDKVALQVFHEADAAPSEVWTYGALAEAVERATAGFLALGLQPGDRVLLRLGNTSRFPLLFFAVAAAGGVALPTSSQLTPAEAVKIAEDAGARILCVEDALAIDAPPLGATLLDDAGIEALLNAGDRAPAREMDPDAPGYLVYTSGATGRPKGVLHAHRAVWARRMMWRDWYGLEAEDRVLHAGAFNWTYTLGAGLMDPWACGAATAIYAGPSDPAVWPKLAQRVGATLFAAVPSLYRRIVKYGDGLETAFANLKHGLTAGEKLPEPVREDWRRATGKEVYEALGMSECSTFVSSRPGWPIKPDRAGWPQRGRRVAVLPVDADASSADRPVAIGAPGVLAVSRDDPGLMLGYWSRPEEDAAARRGDWFLTGDLVRMDPDGAIAHLGRADDLMNAMGYRVGPQEVEDALLSCPGVLECAATEVEVKAGVRAIALFVVVDPNAAPNEETLQAHAAARLAEYKRPRAYHIVDALPRTATGKVQRKRLAAMAGPSS